MPRCNNCTKFVSLNEEDPEVDTLEVDNEGCVTADVRIVNSCAECGEELTETTFSVDDQITMPESDEDEHEHDLEVDEVSCERTQPTHDMRSTGQKPKRRSKTYYGFELVVHVTCKSCGLDEELTLKDDVQASSMETMS